MKRKNGDPIGEKEILYRDIIIPKEFSLYYLAGLMDGEGCIQINKNNNGRGYAISVQVAGTDKELIKAINDSFGGSFIPYIPKKLNRRLVYFNRWYGENARRLLRFLSNKLLLKNKHAILALAFPVLNGPNSINKEKKRLRENIHRCLKNLNSGGN